jgi:hypothetical protein
VAHISEHDSEQERESDASENCRVKFLILRDSVSVYDLLVDPCIVVSLDISGRSDVVIVVSFELSCRVVLEHISDDVFLVRRAPEISDVAAVSLLHHIHSVVERLFLGHEPLVDLEGANFLCTLVIVVHVVNLVLLLSLDLVDLDQIVL